MDNPKQAPSRSSQCIVIADITTVGEAFSLDIRRPGVK
jgi:hypothetical protein